MQSHDLPIKIKVPVLYVYKPIKTLGMDVSLTNHELDNWIETLKFFTNADKLAAYDLGYYLWEPNQYSNINHVTHEIIPTEGGKTRPHSVFWESMNQRFRYWIQAEMLGLDKAQCVLASHYFFGENNCPKNEEAAVTLWEKAALQNLPLAQFNLGYCYFMGIGVQKNIEEGVQLWKQAAEKNLHYAINNLGYCYYHGIGVNKDIEQAVKLWDTIASNKYYNDPQYRERTNQAIRWRNMDDLQICTLALYNLGCCYYFGLGLEKDTEKALELWKKSMNTHELDSESGIIQILFGDYYCDKNNPNKNNDKAIEAYIWAIEKKNNPEAMYKLSRVYRLTCVSEGDMAKANTLLKQACENGSIQAALDTATMFLNGKGIDNISISDILKWLNKAVEQGDFDACNVLGQFYESGKGVIQDFRKAAVLYLKAAEQNIPLAQFDIGRLFMNGAGIEKDIEQAYYWLLLSSANGCEEAVTLRDVCLTQLTSQRIEMIQSEAKEYFTNDNRP